MNVTNISGKNVRTVSRSEFFAINANGRASIYVDTEDFDTPVVIKPGETHNYICKTLADDLIDAGIGWSDDLEVEYVGEVIECNKQGNKKDNNEDACYSESITIDISPPSEGNDGDSDESGDSGFSGGGSFSFDMDFGDSEAHGIGSFNLDW